MSRHRIISRKRNKLIIVAAAGTLTVVTAASAAAAAAPYGPAPASGALSGAAFSAITTRSGQTAAERGSQQTHRAARRFRVIADLQAMATMFTPQQAAAHQVAVAQAAKRRARAELTAKREAARKATQQAPGRQRSGQHRSGQQLAASSVPTASGSPQPIAQAMLGSFGWSASQFSCLEPLWAGESGWSATASNPSTGAYGIPQAMPASKMASAGPNWQTSAATQIRWGLDYIKSTYGSPCAAWSHEEADRWY